MFTGQYAISVNMTAAHIAKATQQKPAICFALEDMILVGDLDGLVTEADKAACYPVTCERVLPYLGTDTYPHYIKAHIGAYTYSIDTRDEPKVFAEMLGIKPAPYGTLITIVP